MPDQLSEFSKSLLEWYHKHRRPLPWRESTEPYKVWLSEIILQQTRVDQGLPYYMAFIENYPDIRDLAEASEEEVLKLWQGLGYYSRARNLHQTARYIYQQLKGKFPESYNELIKLKGVGAYTASAIASICFNEPQAVVDGNVYRVLSRVFGIDADIASSAGKKVFAELAQQLIDSTEPGNYNQAIMEFGAVHCKPANPNCGNCIFSARCEALKIKRVETLPVKLRKGKVKRRYLTYLVVLADNDRTLLRKREARDIWQSLYDFPSVESKEPLSRDNLMASQTYLDLLGHEELVSLYPFNEKPIIHKLSHQELHLSFWVAEIKGSPGSFLMVDEIHNYPVPVPVRNFLSEFGPFQ